MRIVCGTDFSPRAAEAADVASLLAAKRKETLVLLHARADDGPAPDSGDERLRDEAARLRATGVTVREELATGPAAERLVEAGHLSSTRLVAVSSLGQIAPSRFLVGSVAERVAEHSAAPVLIVRRATPFVEWLRGDRPLRILAAYDFSASSDALLRKLREWRQFGPCDITVAHVAWPPRESERLGVQLKDVWEQNPPELQALLERDLGNRVNPLLGDEPATRLRIVASWGRPDLPLLQIASECQADLVAVGTHQRAGLSRFWLGSVSRALIRHATASVLVVPPPAPPLAEPVEAGRFQRVLATTDFSDLGNRMIARAFGALPEGGVICLLHVLPAGRKGVAARTAREQARRRLRELIPARAREAGVPVEIEIVEHAEPATAICQTAERFGADLVCMATHGRTGLFKAVLGSVASAVLARATKPVMLWRPPVD